MSITYCVNKPVSLDAFIDVFERSTLALRRPVGQRSVMEDMMNNAQLTITAWAEETLVGISRTVTDFAYAAYLSDLAVDKDLHGQGIGRELIVQTRSQLGPECTLILLSAPDANDFYPNVGFTHHPRAWVLSADDPIQ